MVLDAEDGVVAVAHPFDGAIVEVDVGDLDFRRKGVRIDGESVVLGSDGNTAGAKVLDRLVASAVAELELESRAAEGMREDLVSQANPEHGEFADEVADFL